MLKSNGGGGGGKFEVRMDGLYCGRFDSAASTSRKLAKIAGV